MTSPAVSLQSVISVGHAELRHCCMHDVNYRERKNFDPYKQSLDAQKEVKISDWEV